MRRSFLVVVACGGWLACDRSPPAEASRPPLAVESVAPKVQPLAASSPVTEPTSTPSATRPTVPLDPSWPKQIFVVTDSVALGAKPYFQKGIEGWKTTVEGQESLSLPAALFRIKKKRS